MRWLRRPCERCHGGFRCAGLDANPPLGGESERASGWGDLRHGELTMVFVVGHPYPPLCGDLPLKGEVGGP
jgi:hypothetical protein